MITRQAIINEARTWIGTKWQHQASLKGVACDCVGLLRGTLGNLTGEKYIENVDYSATWHLFKKEEQLYNNMAMYTKEIPKEEMLPGDLILFGFGKGPAHHCGILATPTTFIHSWADIGKVVETRLDDFWTKHIRKVMRHPEVID